MKPLRFPLICDENIHPEVIRSLKEQGKDVCSVIDEGLRGHPDVDLLRHAHALKRVVLTHDADFGTLAVRQGEPHAGIVYLRPGHISPAFVVEMLTRLDSLAIDVTPPFILVAERREEQIRIRVRSGEGGE